MSPLPANILMLARREASAQRWIEALLPLPGDRWLRWDAVPDRSTLDLVVTDQEVTPGTPGMDDPVPDGAAIVRIGQPGPGDVHLPADVGAGELFRVCQLLAEIVHLRRKLHARTEAQRQLAVEAMSDPLTGLPNRRAWDQVLRERLAAGASPQQLCVAIVDLDFFKRVNDTQGHAGGDQVLRLVGGTLLKSLRADDFVARLGGDEFGLILSVPDAADAGAAVDRVRTRLPGDPTRAASPVVTASAGYCLAPSGNPDCPASAESLYELADAALRKAKSGGRNRTVGG